MPQYSWELQVILKIKSMLPKKYFDGSYIQNQIINEDFTDKDVNKKFVTIRDVLKSYVQYSSMNDMKLKKLSAGELCTVLMLEDLYHYWGSELDISSVLLMAYLHDMDDILQKYLSKKIMGKYHRRNTLMRKSYSIRNERFWHRNSRKYLPLNQEDVKMLEKELQELSQEQLKVIFDGEDITAFAKHVCKVIEAAYGNKVFTLTTFSDEAINRALDRVNLL